MKSLSTSTAVNSNNFLDKMSKSNFDINDKYEFIAKNVETNLNFVHLSTLHPYMTIQ